MRNRLLALSGACALVFLPLIVDGQTTPEPSAVHLHETEEKDPAAILELARPQAGT